MGNSAAALIESGNLLLMGSRAVDKGDWVKMSQAMIEAGKAALKATAGPRAPSGCWPPAKRSTRRATTAIASTSVARSMSGSVRSRCSAERLAVGWLHCCSRS